MRIRTALRDGAELVKLRIQLLALAVAAASLWLAQRAAGETFDGGMLARLLLGMALVCSGAAALNEALEADLDARMERTRHRPIPAGRVSRKHVLAGAVASAGAGVAWLAWQVNASTAGLALAMLLAYDFVYTPLKRASALNTVVGAVPGAMPALVGWSAAGRGLGSVAWALFAILFLWQIPHFLSIAWLYRDDFRRAGLAMITARDHGGRATSRQALAWTLALVPASLLPTLRGGAGPVYFWGALALSLAFLAAALRFSGACSRARARSLLRASVLYLPLLLTLLVADAARSG